MSAGAARLFLAFVAVICLHAGAASAQENGGKRSLAGIWRIDYGDRILGPVIGEARVPEDESVVRVTLTDPGNGVAHTLTSTAIERTGDDTFRITLEGASPYGNPDDGLYYPHQSLIVPSEGEEVRFHFGGKTIDVGVNPRVLPDLDRITLELTFTSDDSLVGEWSFRADPLTHRDARGRGRDGALRAGADGGLEQWGVEVWTRQPPDLVAAITLTDQLSNSSGIPGAADSAYPFVKGQRPVGVNRILFVVGRHIPGRPGLPLKLQATDKHVDYQIQTQRWDVENGDLVGQEYFDRGWAKFLAELPADQHAEARKLDAIIVRAKVLPGVVPGIHSFALNGSDVGWVLQFGDNRAQVSFVRPVTESEFEPSPTFYLPETVRVEVRTHVALPVERIPLVLGGQDGVVTYGDDQGPKLWAYRTAEDPRVYRTAPIDLKEGEPGAATRSSFDGRVDLPTGAGAILYAKIAEPGLVSIEPPVAYAAIIEPPPTGLTVWQEAVAKAAKCFDPAFVPDVNDTYETYSGTSVFDARLDKLKIVALGPVGVLTIPVPPRDIDVTLGDMAVMVMLRERFLEEMRGQQRALAEIKTDFQIRLYRNVVEQTLLDGSPFSRLFVKGPDGADVTFIETYQHTSIADAYRLSVEETDRWVIDATRSAIAQYREHVKQAAERASEVDICDVEAMLGLTGIGFQGMAKALLPTLMRPTSTANNGRPFGWEPDRVARYLVNSFQILPDAIRTMDTYEDIATKAILAMAVPALPAAAYIFAPELIGTALALDAAFSLAEAVVIAPAEAITTWLRADQELKFAMGASAVLGTGRLVLADQQHLDALNKIAFTAAVTTTTVLAPATIFATWRHVTTASRLKRGAELAPRFVKAVDSQTRLRLSRGQWLDLAAHIEHVGRISRHAGRRALTPIQLQTLERFHHLARFKFPGAPVEIGQAAALARRLADSGVPNRNIVRLLPEHAGEIQRLVDDHPDLAIAYLRTHGHESPATLRAQINERVNAWRDGGDRFVTQAAADDAVTPRVEAVGVNIRREKDKFYMTMDRDGQTLTDHVTRSFDPATGTWKLEYARREHLPSRLPPGTLDVEFPDGRGVPTFTYLHMRIANEFGIGYRNTGVNPLNRIVMSTVVNADTVSQLNWFARTHFPGEDFVDLAAAGRLDEAARYSNSVRYAENNANLLGMEITAVRVKPNGRLTMSPRQLRNWYNGNDFEGLLRRYDMDGDAPRPVAWFDIEIDLVSYR